MFRWHSCLKHRFTYVTNVRRLTTALLFLIPVISVALLSGCSEVSPIGRPGNVVTKEFSFNDFTSVDISNGFNVEITRSDSYSITLNVDDSLINNVNIRHEGDTLKICLAPIHSLFSAIKKVKITMPELHAVHLSTGTQGTITGFSSSNDFNLRISTGSQLNGELELVNASFELSTGSSITLKGSASNVTLTASSASTADLADFTVTNANANLSSGSRATLNVTDNLNANLSSASRLYYLGEPTIGSINISSGSSMKRK